MGEWNEHRGQQKDDEKIPHYVAFYTKLDTTRK
jgi:hypothetical protein